MSKNHPLLIDIGHGLSLAVGLTLIASWTTNKRPIRAKRGTFGFNTETSNLEYWDGSNWLAASMKEV